MPSFDIVCEVDLQEIDNAVNQTLKEIENRFDFKGSESSMEFEKEEKKIKIVAADEMKLRSIKQILETKLAKRSVDCRSLKYNKEEVGSRNSIKVVVDLRTGLTKEEAKKITQKIKDSKLKVQAQIQDDQVRVTGKKIDDLQAVIAVLKAATDIGLPLQFNNMRS